ncbi:hypothetical protein [Streptomyces sp. NPDC097619]|uniref:hypothetical protein n=1 Tax=Streptomyces sp. NPDC097619 TaxID=3157228 RepID=UPI003323570F
MRKSFAGLAAAATVAACLLTAAPPASAAGCVTSQLRTGLLGPGETARKANSGCRDLNLTHTINTSSYNSDDYAGFYRDAFGYWTIGSRGYVHAYDGGHALNEIVLVSNLSTGREFSVASKRDGQDQVEITH